MLARLSAIPLPLRIAAGVVVALVAAKLLGGALAGGALGALLPTVTVILWLLVFVTLAHEFGWLDFLSRVPLLSGLLSWLSARPAAIAGAATGGAIQTSRRELSASDRRRLRAEGFAALESLHGIEATREQIVQRLLDPAEADPEAPFGTNAPAVVALFAGPRGVGKTTAAVATAQILAGFGALRTGALVTLRGTELRSGAYRSAAEMGQMKSREAIGGVLLLDDADWLLAPDPYGAGDTPGMDVGLAILDVARQDPRTFMVIATMSDAVAGRLAQDPGHARWLDKLARRMIHFDHLDDETLLVLTEGALARDGWRLKDDSAAAALGRLIAEARSRAGESFDNAEACRRLAETLIEAARGSTRGDTREIDRETVRHADDQLE